MNLMVILQSQNLIVLNILQILRARFNNEPTNFYPMKPE